MGSQRRDPTGETKPKPLVTKVFMPGWQSTIERLITGKEGFATETSVGAGGHVFRGGVVPMDTMIIVRAATARSLASIW